MPVIVIRLHPPQPVTASAFQQSLVGLKISVTDRSFDDPSGTDPGHALGTAEYLVADPDSTIVQHEIPSSPLPNAPMVDASVATAAIEIPSPLPFDEYVRPDLRLTVTRGTRTILVKEVNFNVEVNGGSLPANNTAAAYGALSPVALYLTVPKSQIGLAPGTAYVDIPTDGSPPSYASVLTATQEVLAQDPGAPAPDIATLTPKQCRHVAWEIVSNRTLSPLPAPGASLESLYTGSGADETVRRQFESDLLTYYAVHNTNADVLAKFIYSVSAGLACQTMTQVADKVGLTVPVFPDLPAPSGQPATVQVVVSQ